MASVGAALAGLNAGGSYYCKPGKKIFGFFDCEINCEASVLKVGEVINGNLSITPSTYSEGIKCYGIRVQLDATVNLQFETKLDNRKTHHNKIVGLFQGSSELHRGLYIASPVCQQVAEEAMEELFTLGQGKHVFPFSLQIPEEPLPSQFKSPFGSLQYKIVAYIRSTFCYVQVAEKMLKFSGWHPLSKYSPLCYKPLSHESGFSKSMFSSKKEMTTVLHLKKTGFFPGEEVGFRLIIHNPKGLPLRAVSVGLVRRVIYNADGALKTTLVDLDRYEDREVRRELEISCSGGLSLPRNCIPSYDANPVYNVIYLVQYQVKFADYAALIKGHVEIVIGTLKEGSNGGMELLGIPSQRQRSSSLVSGDAVALPPSYSQLSSRAVSLISLDVPPDYEDVK